MKRLLVVLSMLALIGCDSGRFNAPRGHDGSPGENGKDGAVVEVPDTKPPVVVVTPETPVAVGLVKSVVNCSYSDKTVNAFLSQYSLEKNKTLVLTAIYIGQNNLIYSASATSWGEQVATQFFSATYKDGKANLVFKNSNHTMVCK